MRSGLNIRATITHGIDGSEKLCLNLWSRRLLRQSGDVVISLVFEDCEDWELYLVTVLWKLNVFWIW